MSLFKKKAPSDPNALKLNYKRTFIIGFAFFGILLLWQVYDSWCPRFLSSLFMETFNKDNPEDVQYLVGCMMALDNLAALIMLPIFGRLSDKTHTKIGKRMPYILIGTFLCAVAFPFVPVLVHIHSLWGTIALMAIVVFFAMMYRNPAVALMPDITPKPLRSKANGIINIMGYIGGACATFVGMVPFFSVNKYLEAWSAGDPNLSVWAIEGPFLIASILMVISAIVLAVKIKENKIAEEVYDDMQRGEAVAEVANKVEDDKPMSKANKTMLILILVAEFAWFMADNGIGTFMVNYSNFHLHADFSKAMLAVIFGGVGSVVGFAVGGLIAGKIGRKWSIFTGLMITLLGYLIWITCSYTIPIPIPGVDEAGHEIPNAMPFYIYIVWLIKGFGMSLVHVNSFPMVVELCSSKDIGKFTGFYYASSMAAQTITPIALGSLLLSKDFHFGMLPLYGLALVIVSSIVFAFVKNVKIDKTKIKTGLEAMDVDD